MDLPKKEPHCSVALQAMDNPSKPDVGIPEDEKATTSNKFSEDGINEAIGFDQDDGDYLNLIAETENMLNYRTMSPDDYSRHLGCEESPVKDTSNGTKSFSQSSVDDVDTKESINESAAASPSKSSDTTSHSPSSEEHVSDEKNGDSPKDDIKTAKKKDAGKSKKRKITIANEDSDANKKLKATHMRRNIRDILEDNNLDSETRNAQLKELERIKRVQEAQQRALLEHQKREENQIRDLIEKSNEISDSTKPPDRPSKEVICIDSSEENEEAAIDDSNDATPKKSCDIIDVSSEEDNEDLLTSKGFGLLKTNVLPDKDEEEDDSEEEDPDNSGCHTNDSLNQPDEFGRVLVNVGHPDDEEDIFIAPQIAPIIKPHQIGGIRFLYDNIIESAKNFDENSGFGCVLAHSMGLGKTLQVVTLCDVFLRNTSGKLVIIVAPINTIQNWVNEFDMWAPPPRLVGDKPNVRPRNFKVYTLLDNLHKSVPARHKLMRTWFNDGGVLLMGYEMYRLLTIKNIKKWQARRGKKKMDEIVDLEEEDRNKELLSEISQFLTDPGPDLIICDEGHRIKNNQAGVSQALKNIKTKRRVVLTGYPLQNNLVEYWCMVDFSRPNYLGSKAEFSNMFERPIMNGQCVDSTSNDRRLMKFRAHVLHSLLIGFVQRRSHSVLKYSLPEKQEHVLMIRLTPLQRALYTAFMEELKSKKSIANPLKAFAVCIKICNHLDILHRLMSEKKLYVNDLDLDDSSNHGSSRKKKGGNKTGHMTGNSMALANGSPQVMPYPQVTPAITSQMHQIPNVQQTPSTSFEQPLSSVAYSNDMSVMPIPQIQHIPSPLPVTQPLPESQIPQNQQQLKMTQFTQSPYNIAHPYQSPQATHPPISNHQIPTVAQEMPILQPTPKEKDSTNYDWAMKSMNDYKSGVLQSGYKMVVLFAIIEHSLKLGERLLVFSQSLFTLDLIEEFLQKTPIPLRPNATDAPGEKWARNTSYFRLDGSTSAQDREKLINVFNQNPKIGIFLLSTRAGCLGINLIGANRVIIYDASWNPCHDAQAVCRVYRYGQIRPIHVYRLVTDNTLEKKIYERQVRKRGMSDRVVDELNPEAKFTITEMNTLLNTNEDEPAPLDLKPFATSFTDRVLKILCDSYSENVSQKPFEHESLLLSHSEEKLTKYEKKLAKQSYEFEKRYSSFNKSSYTTVYNNQGSPLTGTPAKIYNNVRFTQPMNILNQQTPIQSTPLPMRHLNPNSSSMVGNATEFSKQGVTVQKLTINKELSITASKPGVPPIVIPSGKQILVLRTLKGVYLRTPEGKVIAVKLPQNKQNATQQPASAAATSKDEVIDISDDDEHGAATQPFRFSGNKSMYNVNSVMHTSGGGILQKKAPNNMSGGTTILRTPVQIGPSISTGDSTTTTVTKTVMKDLSRHGVSIVPSTSATTQPNMVSLKPLVSAKVQPSSSSVQNMVTVPKPVHNTTETIPEPVHTPTDPPPVSSEVNKGSAFSELSDFVHKVNLGVESNVSNQSFLKKLNQLVPSSETTDGFMAPKADPPAQGSGNFLYGNDGNNLYGNFNQNQDSNIMQRLPSTRDTQNFKRKSNNPQNTAPDAESHSMTLSMPNLKDAGLCVDSVGPPVGNSYTANMGSYGAGNFFDSTPNNLQSENFTQKINGLSPRSNQGMGYGDGYIPSSSGTAPNISTSSSAGSSPLKSTKEPPKESDFINTFNDMYTNTSQSNFHNVAATTDSGMYFNHQQSYPAWNNAPYAHNNSYPNQPIMPSLPNPTYMPTSESNNTYPWPSPSFKNAHKDDHGVTNPYAFLPTDNSYLGIPTTTAANPYNYYQTPPSSQSAPYPYYPSQMPLAEHAPVNATPYNSTYVMPSQPIHGNNFVGGASSTSNSSSYNHQVGFQSSS